MRGQSPPRAPSGGLVNSQGISTRLSEPQHPGEHTFFDDGTPVHDTHHSGSANMSARVSHDLSLNAHTRDSVVDNMLLSLDSMQDGPSTFSNPIAPYASFDDEEQHFYSQPDHFTPPRGPRARGHTYSSSNPSEYDLFPTESSKTPTYHHTRRSNSSSNFPPPPSSNDTHGSRVQERRPLHNRGGTKKGSKGSKGSASSSLDYGAKQSAAASLQNPLPRSASFDVNQDPRRRPAPLDLSHPDVMSRGRPIPVTYHSFEAAPSPTVHSGPQRFGDTPLGSPGFPPPPSFAPPQVPSSRRNSIRSATSRSGKKSKYPYPDSTVLNQANEFYHATLASGGQYESMASAPGPNLTLMRQDELPQNSPKERPGFFRRVFGGSSKKENNAAPPPATQQGTQDPLRDERPRTTQTTGRPYSNTLSRAPPGDTMPASTERESQPHPPLPTLQKKHSSFFRRRKKSVAEPMPANLLPLQQQAARRAEMEAAQGSPGSGSVYKANPYVDSAQTSDQQAYDSQRAGSTAGFSPTYNPHRDSTVRTVKPNSRGTDSVAPTSRGMSRAPEPLDFDSPKLRLKVKRGKVVPATPHESTFLADSSGAEDKGSALEPSTTASTLSFPEGRRPSTSPTVSSYATASPRAPDYDSQTKANTAEKRSQKVASEQVGAERSGSKDSSSLAKPTPTRTGPGNRVWLEPRSSDEQVTEPKKVAEEEAAREPRSAGGQSTSSTTEIFHSATSLPTVQIESRPSADEPSAEDRQRALFIYEGKEDYVSKAKACTWLGEVTDNAAKTRKAYMELYDWSGQNILSAMRDLCSRLVLRAETQQVDRVLSSFAQRWQDCNPNNGFKCADIVHAITYSILLLNTDLHMADIEQKMTRVQFVKNTIPTLRRLAEEAGDEDYEEPATIKAPSSQRTSQEGQRNFLPWAAIPEPAPMRPKSGRVTPSDHGSDRPSLENKASRNRLSIRPSTFRAESDDHGVGQSDGCTVLVKAPYDGSLKGWELQMEIVLKEFYNSIRQTRLPLHGAHLEGTSARDQHPAHSSGLTVNTALRRTPSVLSKANSENTSYRGRSADFRSTQSRFNSKNRSRPHLYPSSTVGSSRTSLDDQSVWSPAQSSTWSKYSLGKTQTSMMSVDSLGSHYPGADYQQSIGFANALSQAIIREEGTTAASNEDFIRVAPLLEDESLELSGAPWAKEGILKHKHHLETVDKKAKDRGWNECFAVIEKGYMRLFSFHATSKSLRHKHKSKHPSGSVVGGGNWLENAENMGSFLLRQTIANALPPPGYSKSRPHVWALSLPTGAVHLFQVGTGEIVKEFVSTANYWSARLSKEPLVGGVSNVEYGWGDNVINTALITRPESSATNHHSTSGHGSVSLPRPSMQSSIRSSVDYPSSIRARLPGDKVTIADWTPPVSSMMASNLMEVDQLRGLQAYVRNIEDELARHNELRPPMLIAFSPRHPNAGKALANWEKKSSYLLREIVKFRTYIEALVYAEAAKARIYARREQERRDKEVVDPLSAMSVEVDEGGLAQVDDVVRSLIT